MKEAENENILEKYSIVFNSLSTFLGMKQELVEDMSFSK